MAVAVEKKRTGVVVKDGICYMCTISCPAKIHVRDGKAVKIEMADKKLAAVCPRWKAQLDFIYHPDRLTYPLKQTGRRGSGSFQKISWDEALDTIASRLMKVKAEYGPESVVFWIAYTKEPRPFYHRLAHAFGSPNYCTESSNCFSATLLAANVTYGSDYNFLTGQSIGIDPATKCKMVWASSVGNSAPQVWQEHVEARKKGMKLIVIDSRRTRIASMADIHLQPRPGTDGALALGFMNIIIEQQLYDKEFVEKWTVGFSELKELVKEYTPINVEEITWVPAEKIREAALMYATIKPAQIRLSPNATVQHSNGVQNHRAIILLPALTSNFDIAGGNGWPGIPAPANDITLHERVEGMPPGLGTDRFPIWTSLLREMESNVLADRIESGSPYPIKALFGAGLNPLFFPNSNRFLKAVKTLDFIAVTDYFHNAGTQLADIVLPISSWLERPIFNNSIGGKVTYIKPAIEPVGETWPEWKIYSELAKKLGLGGEFWDGDFDKCVEYMLEPSGIKLEDLKRHPEGLTYPVADRPERSYQTDGFKTPSGKVEIKSSVLEQHGYEPLPVYREPAESPLSRPEMTVAYPLVLTTGARTVTYTHSLFRNIKQLRDRLPDPNVQINPVDAESRKIKTGDTVTVSSPRGTIRLKADVTDIVLPGMVHILHHWPGEANVNILVDDGALDPISGFAPGKSLLCQVKKET